MFIKVCCIADLDEARLALASGASALGLVSAMPSGPGVIDEDRIAAVAAAVPAEAETFLLTSLTDPDAVVAQHRRCRTTTLQFCDALDPDAYAPIREALPGVRLVQVVHMTGPDAVDDALAVAPYVDALLLDSGNPAAAVRSLGGTGRTHDWRLSRAVCERAGVPVLLAGGLGPDNVAEAVRRVRPAGVDVCSGVRTEGRLDPDRLRRFVAALRGVTPQDQ